jgi:hypothetical protein
VPALSKEVIRDLERRLVTLRGALSDHEAIVVQGEETFTTRLGKVVTDPFTPAEQASATATIVQEINDFKTVAAQITPP